MAQKQQLSDEICAIAEGVDDQTGGKREEHSPTMFEAPGSGDTIRRMVAIEVL